MDYEAEIKALKRATQTMMGFQTGLIAAVTLLADHHPNREGMLKSYPALKEFMVTHQLFGPATDEARDAAEQVLLAMLRIPKGS